jgi:tetratricopeptide (TPR) repeat protein
MGLPLAIELAASRTKLLSPAEILERLSDRFRFLTGGQGRPERQETLLPTMEWSYELLEPPDREALDRMAVFKGWALEAAEAVLGPDASGHLERLLDSSLVDVVSRGGVSRYRMLETVRQYGLQRLRDADAEQAARLTHATYYLDLARRSDIGLRSADQSRWLELVRPEHDNIRAALGWALDHDRADLALELVAATGRFWFMQTHWSEALSWLARAAELAAGNHELLWARAFIKTGVIELITMGVPADRSAAQRAHEVLAEQGTPGELAMATYALAEWETDVDEVRTLIEQSLRLFAEVGDEWGTAYVKRWQGSKVELVGDPLTSAQHQREAVVELRRLGDDWTAGWMAFNLGFSLLAAERHGEALVAIDEALELVENINERLVEAHATRGLAALAVGMGRDADARRHYLDAIPMFERIGDVTCLSFSRMFLADVEYELDPSVAMTDRLRQALAGFESLHHEAGIAATYRRFARQALVAGARGRGP